ncbi:MAG TPA: hypothetical protein EYQ43_09960 [Methyloprofundus sp.]|nr:hypothetical protein [Methyloprofundus sp.]
MKHNYLYSALIISGFLGGGMALADQTSSCTTLDKDLNLQIGCIDVGGIKYQAGLIKNKQEGILSWDFLGGEKKISAGLSSEQDEQCATMDKQSKIHFGCVIVDGRLEEAELVQTTPNSWKFSSFTRPHLFGSEDELLGAPAGYSNYTPPSCPDQMSIACHDIDQYGQSELCNAHAPSPGQVRPDKAGAWQKKISIKVETEGSDSFTYPIPTKTTPPRVFTNGNNPALTSFYNNNTPSDVVYPQPPKTIPPVPKVSDLKSVSYTTDGGQTFTKCTVSTTDTNDFYDGINVSIKNVKEGDDPKACTYELQNRCDWKGPKAATLKPMMPQSISQDNSARAPYKSCTGQFFKTSWDKKIPGENIACVQNTDDNLTGGYATFVTGIYPYSKVYGTFTLTAQLPDGADPSCKPGDRTQCAYQVTSELNCVLNDGHADNDLLGSQGDSTSKNYVGNKGKWATFMDKGEQATYDCLQQGTVNGETVCITRQYPLVTHGTYGSWPNDTNNPSNYPDPNKQPMTGACSNGKWATFDHSISKEIVTQQRTFVKLREQCVGSPTEDNPEVGCMVKLPAATYFDANGTEIKQALLSIGHGTMLDRCGDITLASNGNNAILEMVTGTRSWSFEIQSPSGSWLACESAEYYKMNMSACDAARTIFGYPKLDAPTGQGPLSYPADATVPVNGKSQKVSCKPDGTQGIQPWVQKFDFKDLPTTGSKVTLPAD